MNTGKEPFKCGMERAECGVRPNLISVIAKHRALRSKAPEGWRTPRRFAFTGPLLISARFWTAVALHRFSHVRPTQNEYRKRVPVRLHPLSYDFSATSQISVIAPPRAPRPVK